MSLAAGARNRPSPYHHLSIQLGVQLAVEEKVVGWEDETPASASVAYRCHLHRRKIRLVLRYGRILEGTRGVERTM